MLKILLFILTLYFFNATTAFAQNPLPQVFMIGDNDRAYGELLTQKPPFLLTVCKNDMDIAYDYWLAFLADIEHTAIEQNFDIRGVKIWIHVFWNPDGTIKHIAFYPKPNSRDIDYVQFGQFLTDFSTNYQLDLKYQSMFVHYASASFPTFIFTDDDPSVKND